MGLLRTVTRPDLMLLVASLAVVIIATSAQAAEEENGDITGAVTREVDDQEENITKRLALLRSMIPRLPRPKLPPPIRRNPSRRRNYRPRRRKNRRRSKQEALSKRQTELNLDLGNQGVNAEISHRRGNHRFSAGYTRSNAGNSIRLGYERRLAGGGKIHFGAQRVGGHTSFGAGNRLFRLCACRVRSLRRYSEFLRASMVV